MLALKVSVLSPAHRIAQRLHEVIGIGRTVVLRGRQHTGDERALVDRQQVRHRLCPRLELPDIRIRAARRRSGSRCAAERRHHLQREVVAEHVRWPEDAHHTKGAAGQRRAALLQEVPHDLAVHLPGIIGILMPAVGDDDQIGDSGRAQAGRSRHRHPGRSGR